MSEKTSNPYIDTVLYSAISCRPHPCVKRVKLYFRIYRGLRVLCHVVFGQVLFEKLCCLPWPIRSDGGGHSVPQDILSTRTQKPVSRIPCDTSFTSLLFRSRYNVILYYPILLNIPRYCREWSSCLRGWTLPYTLQCSQVSCLWWHLELAIQINSLVDWMFNV